MFVYTIIGLMFIRFIVLLFFLGYKLYAILLSVVLLEFGIVFEIAFEIVCGKMFCKFYKILKGYS